MILHGLLLVIGFALLIKGADWFTGSASAIASKAGISQLVTGLTIVAIGTSIPEAAVSISSAVKGDAGLAVGTVIGSNILNVLFILGITAMLVPLDIQKSTTRVEMPLMAAVSGIMVLLGLGDSMLGRGDGAILLALFLIYLVYLVSVNKREYEQEKSYSSYEEKSVPGLIVFLVLGLSMTVFGSCAAVDAAAGIALEFGVSSRIIGLTVIALGTSLPELATCIAAAAADNTDMAMGNIVGSNIFNILFVIGATSVIVPLEYSSVFLVDSIFCIGSAILLCIFVLNRERQLRRMGGIVMMIVYLAYFCITAF